MSERNTAEESQHHKTISIRQIITVILLIIGYLCALPILISMIDWQPSDAMQDWLNHPLHMGSLTMQPIWILVITTVIGLVCWIIAGLLSRQKSAYGTASHGHSSIRPLLTAVTVICAFFVCLGLPMLCLMHL